MPRFEVEIQQMEASDLNQWCVRCSREFDRVAFDATLVAQLMGRDPAEVTPGSAICERCIEADELRALEAAKRVDS
jgi:hypothetical protein